MPASDALPAQRVTPPLALYLARRAGCRLPSAAEWRAALDAARGSADPIARGFATQGWKLRTAASYAALLSGPTRDPAARPADGGFAAGPSDAVWSPAAVAKLGGRLVGDGPPRRRLAPVDAGDGRRLRLPPRRRHRRLRRRLPRPGRQRRPARAGRPGHAGRAAGRHASGPADVRAWFTPDRLAAVSVVGGSAVSPPSVTRRPSRRCRRRRTPTSASAWPSPTPPPGRPRPGSPSGGCRSPSRREMAPDPTATLSRAQPSGSLKRPCHCRALPQLAGPRRAAIDSAPPGRSHEVHPPMHHRRPLRRSVRWSLLAAAAAGVGCAPSKTVTSDRRRTGPR